MTSTTQLTLTGEQHLVLTLPPREPVLIKGAAGSGKTTVAVYRAKHLCETYGDLFRTGRVLVLSYTNKLVDFIHTVMPDAPFTVSTYHKQAFTYARRSPRYAGLDPEGKCDPYVQKALALARRKYPAGRAVLAKDVSFYKSEIGWIKGRVIDSFEEYRDTPRTGRGTADRVTATDREILWDICTYYNEALRADRKMDFEDMILGGLAAVSSPGFHPPYTHIVLDEAQDCTFAALSFIARLVSPETNSITLVGDAAQRIYQSGFSWAETGIRVAGARSREFKKNYRNTRQIFKAAASLLAHESEQTDFTLAETPAREGAMPVLCQCPSPRIEADFLVRRIAELPAGDSVLVAAPTRNAVRQITAELMARGIRVKDGVPQRSEGSGTLSRTVSLSVMNSSKGLLDYIRINDELRLDGRRDCINLSIQHPNTCLFRRFRERHVACDLWLVLSFSAVLLDAPGALFTTGNAAATAVKRHGTAGGVSGFEALFADGCALPGMPAGRMVPRGRLAPCHPTSIQAEVLLPAAIPVDRIAAISAETREGAARTAALLRCMGAASLAARTAVCPELFTERK